MQLDVVATLLTPLPKNDGLYKIDMMWRGGVYRSQSITLTIFFNYSIILLKHTAVLILGQNC